MNQANFEAAKQYALDRLEHDLPEGLSYHTPAHSLDDVAGAAARLAEIEGVTGEALMLLLTAAYYHDIGYVEKRAGHEAVGIRIAAEVLPGFGFSPEQIDTIRAMIQATVTPQSPHTLLEQILADADLDVLGRHDFWEKNQRLRAELAAQGRSFSDEEWYEEQLALHASPPLLHPLSQDAAQRRQAAPYAEAGQLLEQSQAQPVEAEEPALVTRKGCHPPSGGLFAGTPDHILADVAELPQICAAEAGTAIFRRETTVIACTSLRKGGCGSMTAT